MTKTLHTTFRCDRCFMCEASDALPIGWARITYDGPSSADKISNGREDGHFCRACADKFRERMRQARPSR